MASPFINQSFGGSRGGIRWNPPLDKLGVRIKDYRDPIYDVITKRMKPIRDEMRVYAKSNAPWDDRTGKARRGLFAFQRRGASYFLIGLAHSPSTVSEWNGSPFYYGVALETFTYSAGRDSMSEEDYEEYVAKVNRKSRWRQRIITAGERDGSDETGRGEYAIIMPTIDIYGPRMMAAFKGALTEAIKAQR